MENYNLAIIGAGASGLAAAISASRNHPGIKISVFEHLPKAGKKLLATGNGRCNLTNINALSHPYHNYDFAQDTLNKYPPEKVIDFFGSLGMLTYTDPSGRVYPRSNNASSVLDALRFSLDKNTDVFTDTRVSSIKYDSGKYIINNSVSCDKVIIAAGGKSSPSQGSDGSGYAIAESLGHSITPLFPSLTPLNTDHEKVKSLKGVRASGVSLKLECRNVVYNSSGEILFTQTGISGIAAMELARAAGKDTAVNSKPVLVIDFIPELSAEELSGLIKKNLSIHSDIPAESLLTGIIPKAIGLSILKYTGMHNGNKLSADIPEVSRAVSEEIKNFRLEITGTKGFNDSQVTSGGVDINEINPYTLESKINNGLYFCGEIIDVDGGCGGFNLQWAFASGLTAGELNGQN